MLAEKIKITLAELAQRVEQNIIANDDTALATNLTQYQLALHQLVAACPRYISREDLGDCLQRHKTHQDKLLTQLKATTQMFSESVQANQKIRQYFTS